MPNTIETTERDQLRESIIQDQDKRAKEIAAQLRATAKAEAEQSIEDQARAQAAAEAAESRRLARIEELRHRVQTELTGEELVAALEKFSQATEDFVSACKSYDDRHSDILEPIIHDGSLQPLPAGWGNAGFNLYRLQIDGEEIHRAKPQGDISQTVRAIYQKYYPRQNYSLDNPQD
jgi:hypothetical protein